MLCNENGVAAIAVSPIFIRKYILFSDPNTGFSACANYGGAIGLKKGSSKNVANYVAFGESAGWTEKGYDPSAGTALWGYFMFWSNTTSI